MEEQTLSVVQEKAVGAYQALRDGSDRSVPQIASFDQKSIINGGFEDE